MYRKNQPFPCAIKVYFQFNHTHGVISGDGSVVSDGVLHDLGPARHERQLCVGLHLQSIADVFLGGLIHSCYESLEQETNFMLRCI